LSLVAAAGEASRLGQGFVAGVVPRAGAIADADLANAVRGREDAIAQRARVLAGEAVQTGATWARPFGPPPVNPVVADAWWDRLATIAAYRDHWCITASTILGDEASVSSLHQAAHRYRARRAGQEAAILAGVLPLGTPSAAPAPGVVVKPAVDI